MAFGGFEHVSGTAAEEDLSFCKHSQIAAGLADVFDDVSRKQDDTIRGEVDQ